MTKGEMQQRLGTPFIKDGLTGAQMDTYLSGLPDGTVSVIARRPNTGGLGHFFWSIKLNGTVEYWDAQSGTPMMSRGAWNFDINVVGNRFCTRTGCSYLPMQKVEIGTIANVHPPAARPIAS
jgi:hypothetical protein